MKNYIIIFLGSLLYINYRLAYVPLVHRPIATFRKFQNQTKEEGQAQLTWMIFFDMAIIAIALIGWIWTIAIVISFIILNYAFYGIHKLWKRTRSQTNN